MGGQVAGLRKHPFGRVDQLEDRYLGMVEAPSSNLGTSTPLASIELCGRALGKSIPDVFELPSLSLSPVLTRGSRSRAAQPRHVTWIDEKVTECKRVYAHHFHTEHVIVA